MFIVVKSNLHAYTKMIWQWLTYISLTLFEHQLGAAWLFKGTDIVMGDNSYKTFELNVKKEEPTLVPPAAETEKGLYFLSNLDQNIAVIVRTLYYYKSDSKGNEDVVEVMKKALSDVLVHYYPLAGRLSISTEGKLIVDCTGDGAVFVEAEANCEMEEVGDITKPDPVTDGKLIYDVPGANNILEIPPLVVQV